MNNDPIFKPIFGDDWHKLPPVIHKHYANRPFTSDVHTVTGVMDISCSGPFKLFAWLFWLMRGIPPHNEKNVPVTVNFESDPHSKFFQFNRTFNFATRSAYRFKSRMIQRRDNEVVEVMASNVGWRMQVVWEDERVKLKHKGYVLYAFGYFIPLPITWLIGAGNAEEIAIDVQTFEMQVNISHRWWGKIYEYKGRFRVMDREMEISANENRHD